MSIESIQTLAQDEMDAVDVLIRAELRSDVLLINQISEHIIAAGGKRLRPMLTVVAARAAGYTGQDHTALAAIIEFIHTATLLHDDVVDESAQRRGRPTANLLWDNKSSILVGDYLFSRAFQLMVDTGSLDVLAILSNASATIAEGEVLQLSAARDLSTNEEIYLQVVRGKTAALFSAATEVGGVIANAPKAVQTALFDYGDALGVAFQIVDDLLDVSGDPDVMGKNIGDDFRERKLTLPFIKAVAKSTADEQAFWKRTIEKGDQQEGDLARALEILKTHHAIEETRQDALQWSRRAQNALAPLPDHPMKALLATLATYVVERIT